jgi:hypothetical protein
MVNILVIPDSHVRPGIQDISRFHHVAKLLDYRRPQVLVHLGDMWDMESLCSYDAGKKSFEGRRYKRDIEAGVAALKLLKDNCSVYSKTLKLFCPGNHENRIHRAVEEDAKLEGLISSEDFKLAEYDFRVKEFLVPHQVEGVSFLHYQISGLMGRPIGGENPAANILKKGLVSTVVGHSHVLDFSERTNANGKKLMGLVAGSFLAQGQKENYAGAAQKLWWNGVCYLHNVKEGAYDLETISLSRLTKGCGKV